LFLGAAILLIFSCIKLLFSVFELGKIYTRKIIEMFIECQNVRARGGRMAFGRRVKKQQNNFISLGLGFFSCVFFPALAFADPPIPAPVQVIVDIPKTIQMDANSGKVKNEKPGGAPEVIEGSGAVQRVPAVPTEPVSSMPLSADDVIEGSSGMELPAVAGDSLPANKDDMPSEEEIFSEVAEEKKDVVNTDSAQTTEAVLPSENGGMWALRRALKERLQKTFSTTAVADKAPEKKTETAAADSANTVPNLENQADPAIAGQGEVASTAGTNANENIAAAPVDVAAPIPTESIAPTTDVAQSPNQAGTNAQSAETIAVPEQKNSAEEDFFAGVAPVADEQVTILWRQLQVQNPDLKLAEVSARLGECGGLLEAFQQCSNYRCSIELSASGMKPIEIAIEKDAAANSCVLRRVAQAEESICPLNNDNRNVFQEEWRQYLAVGESIYANNSGNVAVLKANSVRQKCREEMLAKAAPEPAAIKKVEKLERKTEVVVADNLQNPQKAEYARAEVEAKKLAKKEKEKRANQAKQVAVEQAISKNQPYFEYLDKTRKRQEKSDFAQETDEVFKRAQRVVGGAAIPDEKIEHNDSLSISRGSQNKKTPENIDGVRRSDGPMDIAVRDTNKPEDFLTTQVQLESAYRALMAGQTEAAIGIYKQVLVQSSKNQTALFGMATAYHRNGQFDQARQIYTELLQLDPNNIEALNNFLVLAAEESPEDALVELKKLERLNSGFSPVAAQIGMIYFRSNDLNNAARYLNRAVTLSPENVTYRYNLAVIYDKLGRYSQASALYQQVVKSAEEGRAVLPVSVLSLRERMAFIATKVNL
jgi:tetratricopeptide (TPR) repeat protein